MGRLVAYALSLWVAVSAVPAYSATHALLIGISDYSKAEFSDLPGAANDIRLMHEVLRDQLGVPETNIHTLTDHAATHTGIERAFESLYERLRDGDRVYVHYSGHGSQTEDLNGDERSGRDQTWVSWGSRGEEDAIDAYDVLDDEVNLWIGRLSTRAAEVVVVVDSCHSGTSTRSAVAVRSAPAETRENVRGRESMPARLGEANVIRIGSARDIQFAAETLAPDRSAYGVFTWNWAAALAAAPAGATWGQIFDTTAARVARERGAQQVPQFNGPRNVVAATGARATSSASVAVTAVEGSRVTLATGALTGATVGSIFGTSDETGVRLVLDRVNATRSVGQLSHGQVGVGTVLQELEHRYEHAPLRVWVDATADDDATSNLRASIAAAPGFELTPERLEADLMLVRGHTGQPDHMASVLTAAGEMIHDNLTVNLRRADAELDRLRDNLAVMARARALRLLGGSRRAQLDMQATVLEAVDACDEADECIDIPDLGLFIPDLPEPVTELSDRELLVGDIVTFNLRNDGRRAQYIYVLNVSPDGAISVVFPEEGSNADEALLQPGEALDLFELGYGVETQLPGEELIKVIASRQPVAIHLLTQTGYRTRSTETLNPLEQLLDASLQGTRAAISIRTGSWSSLDVAFPVQ